MDTQKSRKFTTMAEARDYLTERGKLEYFGRDGIDAKTYVYTLTIGVRVYHILLRDDGFVTVTHERYV
jgi:hypothetical protein